MLKGERRQQKHTRRREKVRRKSNRKALQVIIEAKARRRNTRPGAAGTGVSKLLIS